MSRRVAIHHFVANKVTRQHGPGQTAWDLLDVNYWRRVPADTEFPRVFGQMDLFTRFYLTNARPAEFFVRVWWDDSPTRGRELIGQFGPFLVPFQPADLVRDYAFRLYNIQFRGVGRHTIRLVRDRRAAWPATSGWGVVAETHFTVER